MITISDALLVYIQGLDNVDETNILRLMRNGENNMLEALLGTGVLINPAERMLYLHTPMNEDEVDSLIIKASSNGMRDLFN